MVLIVLLRLRVPVREAFREISAILVRREERGRSGLGDLSAPSSESSSSCSSSKTDPCNGEADRGSDGGESVDRKSSRSVANFAITCSNACDSASESEVAVISTVGGVGGIDFAPILEDVVGRVWGMTLVEIVGVSFPSRIVSCRGRTSFVGELAVVGARSVLVTVAVTGNVAFAGCRIAGSNPSSPAMKKKSANVATIVSSPSRRDSETHKVPSREQTSVYPGVITLPASKTLGNSRHTKPASGDIN